MNVVQLVERYFSGNKYVLRGTIKTTHVRAGERPSKRIRVEKRVNIHLHICIQRHLIGFCLHNIIATETASILVVHQIRAVHLIWKIRLD